MILRDKLGRIWLTTQKGLQLWGFHVLVVRERKEKVVQLVIGWDARWKAKQAPLEKCRACARWVKSPCHDSDGYHENGPWDYSCEMILFPWRYQ